MRLGESLLNDGKINCEQLKFCLDVHKINPSDRFGEVAEYFGMAKGIDIAQFNALKVGWKLFEGEYIPDWEAINKVGLTFFQENRIYPLAKQGKTAFVLAYIETPKATDWLKENGFEDAIFYIGVESAVRRELDLLALLDARRKTGTDLVVVGDVSSVDSATEWFDDMLKKAVLYRATDVHIESSSKGVLIRFRIDGTLVPACVLPRDAMNVVANIIYNRCSKDPSQFGKLLDGRFSFNYLDRCLDIRFSQVPLVEGPRISLRILDKLSIPYSLDTLGYSDHNLHLIDRAMMQPHGVILVTGPTGCGKSTTNHAILNELKDIGLNIMTAEDPVEVKNPGVSQLQVNESQGITFASALRSFLRQDPDIIMVGEIRDHETAEIAIQSAQTGHLLFSTLHTNDPYGAILRLLDLGVPRINISSALGVVISQRLVRKLCPYCKRERVVLKEKESAAVIKYLINDEQRVYEAQGCPRCLNGYWGRTVVAEVLVINDGIRDLIDRDRVNDIPGLLRAREDYKNIHDDARRLIDGGVTSIEEVISVLG